jgi:hypothetical protein
MLPVKVHDIGPRLQFGQTFKSDRKIFRVAFVQSFRIELKFRVKTSTGVHRLLKGSSIIGPIVYRLPVAVTGLTPVTVGIVRIIFLARKDKGNLIGSLVHKSIAEA